MSISLKVNILTPLRTADPVIYRPRTGNVCSHTFYSVHREGVSSGSCFIASWDTNTVTVADLRGARDARPPGPKVLHFHAVFGEKFAKQ